MLKVIIAILLTNAFGTARHPSGTGRVGAAAEDSPGAEGAEVARGSGAVGDMGERGGPGGDRDARGARGRARGDTSTARGTGHARGGGAGTEATLGGAHEQGEPEVGRGRARGQQRERDNGVARAVEEGRGSERARGATDAFKGKCEYYECYSREASETEGDTERGRRYDAPAPTRATRAEPPTIMHTARFAPGVT